MVSDEFAAALNGSTQFLGFFRAMKRPAAAA
jgi:hypothetical protein